MSHDHLVHTNPRIFTIMQLPLYSEVLWLYSQPPCLAIHWWRWLYSHQNVWIIVRILGLYSVHQRSMPIDIVIESCVTLCWFVLHSIATRPFVPPFTLPHISLSPFRGILHLCLAFVSLGVKQTFCAVPAAAAKMVTLSALLCAPWPHCPPCSLMGQSKHTNSSYTHAQMYWELCGSGEVCGSGADWGQTLA